MDGASCGVAGGRCDGPGPAPTGRGRPAAGGRRLETDADFHDNRTVKDDAPSVSAAPTVGADRRAVDKAQSRSPASALPARTFTRGDPLTMDELVMTQPQRIVIVEDDLALARGLQRLLTADGFDVALAFNGAELRVLLSERSADLVLLDLNLAGEDGMDIARELGVVGSAGLIIVTGRGDKSDCVSGLEAGADDYVSKPFDHDILLARIRAVLRRRSLGRDALPVLSVGPYRLNTVDRRLSREGHSVGIDLTATETALVAHLMSHLGAPVHRADLARGQAWTPDDRATDVHVSHIRRKLLDGGMPDFCIQPVRGYGYQLSLVQKSASARGAVAAQRAVGA